MDRIPTWERVLTMIFVWAPPVVLVWGIVNFWNEGVNTLSLTLFASFVLGTGLGVTVGFHRLFTHKSFETFPFVGYLLAILAMFSAQKSVYEWVAIHRKHHQYSDKIGDPHSPHLHGGGVKGLVLGFIHAHVGWFSGKLLDEKDYIIDLKRDGVLAVISALYPFWVILGLILPAFIAFSVTGSTHEAFLGFIWGGVIRLGVVYHITWSVNSVCHIWGYRRFETSDHSTNQFFVGLVGFGEGWHNNHHAEQKWARHGIYWWEVDLSWYLICLLGWLRLAWDIRIPTAEEIEARKKTLEARRVLT